MIARSPVYKYQLPVVYSLEGVVKWGATMILPTYTDSDHSGQLSN